MLKTALRMRAVLLRNHSRWRLHWKDAAATWVSGIGVLLLAIFIGSDLYYTDCRESPSGAARG